MLEPITEDDPRQVGPFLLEGRLGAGSMARVCLGRRADDTVAAVRRVHGPHTAALIDADSDATRPWLATEYLPGQSLRAVLAERGPLPAEQVLRIGNGIARALAAIHAAGVVHRDLKPGNVILLPDGPRVIDFGIARATDVTHRHRHHHRDPAYLAPEQVRGDHTGPAADVFALGALLVYAATGRTAFGDGPTSTILYRITHGEPQLDGIAEPLLSVVTACLEKDPALRPTPAQLADVAIAPRRTATRPLVPPRSHQEPDTLARASRRGAVAALAAAVLLLAGVVVVPLSWRTSLPGTPVAGAIPTSDGDSEGGAGPDIGLICEGDQAPVVSGAPLTTGAVDSIEGVLARACPAMAIDHSPEGTGAAIQRFVTADVTMALADRARTRVERTEADARCSAEVPATAALPIKLAFRSAESTSTLVFQQYLDRAADWPSGVDTSFTGGTGTGYPTEEDPRSAVGVGHGGIGYAGATDLGSGTEARPGDPQPHQCGSGGRHRPR